MKTTLRIVLTTLLCFALSLLIPTNGVFAEGTASGVLSLPASTLIVDIEAFYGDTSINKVILPNGLKEIRARAFADSTLSEINLPDSLTLIDESAFSVPGNITVTANKGSWVYNWAKTKGFKMYDDPSPLADFVFQAIDDTGSRIAGYQGNGGRVVIPAADADGRTVKEIGSSAFYNCNTLTEVVLPSALEKLGDSTFANCKNLTTVNIPSGLQQVYYYSSGPFTGCEALTNVEIEDGMVTIPSSLFAKSGIREIRIPDSVKNISREVFMQCTSLENVIFPEGLENIGTNCFYGCTSLKKVNLPETVRNLGGVLGSNGWDTANGSGVFRDCTALAEVTLPQNLDFASSAFTGCSALKTVHFAEGTIALPYSTFNNCGLEEITLPETTKRIEGFAFQSCANLSTIHLNEGLQEIGSSAFNLCNSLVEITLPSTLETLGDSAFGNCSNLEAINIPAKLQTKINTYYGSGPFTGCEALTNVEIEDGMVTIPSSLFAKSGIREIRIPDSVKNISREVFMQCTSLENVIFPEGLENIGTDCFYGCTSLKKVNLPETVRNLGGSLGSNGWDTINGSGVFRDCSTLAEVTLPQNLDFANTAFAGCSALKTVTMLFPSQLSFRALFGWSGDSYSFSSSNPNVASVYINSGVVSTYSIGSTVIRAVRDGTVEAELTVYVRNGYVDSGSSVASGILREGDEWAIRWMITYDEDTAGTPSNAQLYIYLEGSIASAGELALNSSLEDENLMPWLTTAYGFQKTDFNYIHIQGSATNPFKTIPGQFSGYSNVRRVELTCVRNIQAESFCDCSGLEQLVFDNWLLEIGNAAFKNDVNMNAQILSTSSGSSIASIGEEAFMNTGLTSFNSGSSLRQIGNRAFQNTPLSSLKLGKGVITVGERAFYNTGLAIVRLEKNLRGIGVEAFAGNPGLTIRCYRNSAAQQYAERENIPYVFIDNYDDHVVFNGGIYRENNTLTDLQFGWSYDLFNRTASSPSKELAIASLVLAADAYEWDLLSSAFSSFGFEQAEPYNYDDYDDMNRIGYGIASKTLDINGRDTNIIVVVCRGSSNGDDWASNIFQQAQGFRFAANDVLSRLDEYISSKRINRRLPTKLLITGHSRGAAVASILGTIVPFDSDNVYVYTFASPNTTTDANRFNYDHICNVIVDGDPVPPLPPMVGGDNKFGRIVSVKASVNNSAFISAFQEITGGVSTAAIDNNAECISNYDFPVIMGAARHHAPAVYLACILEPCNTAAGNQGLEYAYALNQSVAYSAVTYSR